MDLRKERTKRNIINAFLELRAKKPLEKISVKELSELALINKATFYSHYEDLYALSEQLETEIIDNIFNSLSCIDSHSILNNPRRYTSELMHAFLSQRELLDIVFSGNRRFALSSHLERKTKEIIYRSNPELKNNLEWDIKLTILIQGCNVAFLQYENNADINELPDIFGRIVDRLMS
ncbi:MAG: TetR/AcrR family transcriptional regulator [Lachnospiraceae bacterium]|nr:TetR/AcrR family transcriptional regulator [Lachnospiraceae bacterium]